MKRWKLLNSSGDTIIEVMVVLAILGLAFSISYATATHGLAQARNAEEHSEALGLLDSQVELVRSYFSTQPDTSALTGGTDFCMTNPASPTVTPLNHNVPQNPASDVLDPPTGNYPAACINSFYHESIDYNTSDATNPFFDFRIRWEGLGTLGSQQEELTYKIFPSSLAGGEYGDVGPGPTTPPPTGTPFSWTANGKNYASCVNDSTDPLAKDGNDGCDPSASPSLGSSTSMFARRGVDVIYNFGGTNVPSETATLSINYNQYAGAGTLPPAGYQYHLDVFVISSGNVSSTLVAGGIDLPISNTSTSYNALTDTVSVNVPISNPSSIELEWNNNLGTDPDLQINSVTLSNP